jgi:hypothetical protein
MSFQVTTAFTQQYGRNVLMLAQQKGSRLRTAVTVENVTGEDAYLDQVGTVAAQPVTNRHGDSPLNSTPHSRRRLDLVDYDTGDLIDKLDKVKMLIDPSSAYAQAHANAMGRAMDDVIINAAFAASKTGKDGSTSTTFPAGQVVAVNSWSYGTGSGNVGLTISKLIEAKGLFGESDVDPDEELYIAVAQKQINNLLATTEATSADYANVKALQEGKIDTFMGFKFIRTQRLLTDGSSFRRVMAWAKSGLGLGIGMDIQSEVAPRPDKRFSMYAYFRMSIGATRLEESKVVEIKCTEP